VEGGASVGCRALAFLLQPSESILVSRAAMS